MKKIIFLISLVLLTSGCSVYHITSNDITTDFYPSKRTAKDVAFLENVIQPHSIIGYVTVNAERRQNMSEVMEKMKREAAILGGDAITDIQTDATGQWKSLPVQNVIGNAYIRANFSASIVSFK